MYKTFSVKPKRICECNDPRLEVPKNIHDTCYCDNCGGALTIYHHKIREKLYRINS